MTVTSIAVPTTKFLFGMCNCTVDSDVGIGSFSLLLGILHMCGHMHLQSQVSLSMGIMLSTFDSISSGPILNQGKIGRNQGDIKKIISQILFLVGNIKERP